MSDVNGVSARKVSVTVTVDLEQSSDAGGRESWASVGAFLKKKLIGVASIAARFLFWKWH
ncbi:hypothetical protein V5279_05020 [Bradyrhizobium sp. 26S5]|uniref:hypothetical protein n=1 Tax=Bradyrhizobium sp. 26S5 TaxID=3139729 RepID=UPI0030D2E62C